MRDELGRAQALATLEEWTKGESLRKHGMAVSVCTEAYGVREAERLGLSGAEAAEFVELYASAGLLHDMDYERHPTQEEHPFVGVNHLREQGGRRVCFMRFSPMQIIRVRRESRIWIGRLFACDELAGFLTACALVKPSKSIREVEVAGVKKKMKDKAFARAVKREDITDGAELLGLSVEEHVGNCLRAMQARAGELGLQGNEFSRISRSQRSGCG